MTHNAERAKFARRGSGWLILIAGLCAGCATIGGGEQAQSLVPSRMETRTGPFAVYTNQSMPADAPVVRSLQSLEKDLTAILGLRVKDDGAPVEVYILNNREAFTHFLTYYYPELPPRRAFFLADGPRRVVYTYYNDRLDEDLRHEATHALLHVAVGDLPLWLDEGLAEYFEGPEGRQGLNPEHLARLPEDLKSGWKPDLARLETLKNVREMTPRDYRESWAWVHYLLNEPGPGKTELLKYLGEVRAGDGSASLSAGLAREEEEADRKMLAHLEEVRKTPLPSTASATLARGEEKNDSTLLLQSHTPEPPATAKRGMFGRFLAMIGLGAK